MFRIECFVDDKHLASVMHALAGRTMNLSAVPVVNAVAAGGRVAPVTSGKIEDLFVAWAKANKVQTFKAKDSVLNDFLASMGKPPSAKTYAVVKLKEAGVLRGKGKGSNVTWTVVQR